MRAVYCFSGTGHSWAVAEYLAKELGAPVFPVGGEAAAQAQTAVVVFPVYSQNIPAPVRAFLPTVKAEKVVLIATYGRMGCGNVLWEAANLVKGTVIAGAYVPVGHTYLDADTGVDCSPLQPIVDRIRDPKPVTIPRLKKWWLADVFPDLRSKWSVKLRKTAACTQCGLCDQSCPMHCMKKGTPGKGCIRCLRCVKQCPEQALSVSYHPVLRFYLRKPRQEEWNLYI